MKVEHIRSFDEATKLIWAEELRKYTQFPAGKILPTNSFKAKARVKAKVHPNLDDNNLHELLQSAYKQGHSTETTLVKVQNDILRSIDERNCIALLLIDLSAAFDTVDHSKLLSRLRYRFGIDGKALKWLHSYLTIIITLISITLISKIHTYINTY